MRARTLLSSQPCFALVGSGEAAGCVVSCLSTRMVGHAYQAQAANPDCSAGFIAPGKTCGFERCASDVPWLSVCHHPMLQGCCPGKLGLLQSFMMPGTRREARGEFSGFWHAFFGFVDCFSCCSLQHFFIGMSFSL